MINKSTKSIDINGTKFSQASELGASYRVLDRLVDASLVTKVTWNGFHYYADAKARAALSDKRTIPAGYVRASDHAILIGSTRYLAYAACGKRGAPAKLVMDGTTKSSWYVDKTWLEKQLGYTAPKVTKTAKVVEPTIASLQAQIDDLKKLLGSKVAAAPMPAPMPAKGIITAADAQKQGFEPLQDITDALGVPRGTLTSWYTRNQVRSLKINGRVYLHMDDVHKRLDNVPTNREKIAACLGTTGQSVFSGVL